MTRLLTIKETAELLNVSVSTMYQLVEQGKLVCYRIGTGRGSIRFRLEEIEVYLASCRSTPEGKQVKPLVGKKTLSHLSLRKPK